MDIRDLLPIGSVVLLKGAKKRLMIFGVKQLDDANPDVEFDYSAVPYPEGNMGKDTQYMFNHGDIAMVAFRGFEDEERGVFVDALNKYYEQKGIR